MKVVTLLFLQRKGQMLLAMKKRGFGVGKWNGVGGKVEQGESVESAAIRECHEEIGVIPHNLKLMGRLQFFERTDPEFHHDCYVYTASAWQGDPIETDEMRPAWFKHHEIPYQKMWADDTLWIPFILRGQRFAGKVTLDGDHVYTHDIKIAPEFEAAGQIAPKELLKHDPRRTYES